MRYAGVRDADERKRSFIVKQGRLNARREPLITILEPGNSRAAPSWRAFLELGFRPLYLLGCGWAMLSVLLWVFLPQWLTGTLTGVAWHAHEMLWGFVATIAVGFLLTAAATWTGRDSLSGWPLAVLCAVWLIARIGFLVPGLASFCIASIAESLFFAGATWVLAGMIYGAKSKRNYGVPLLVAGLGLVNALFLWRSTHGDYGSLMHWFYIGLLTMSLIALLISRRVIPFFAMRAIIGLQLPMHQTSGQGQMALMLFALGFALIGKPAIAGIALGVVACIAIWQLASWQPLAVRTKPLLWVLYAGYGGLSMGLLLAAAYLSGLVTRGAWSVHVLGIGGFSLLIIGMITRTALGHTGRKLAVDRMMTASFALMIFATLLRVGALITSSVSALLLQVSALLWAMALVCYLIRFTPILIRSSKSGV